MNTTMEFISTLAPIALELVGTLAVLLVTKIAIPWLKEQRIYSTIRRLTQAAEKLAETGAIEKVDKKAFVIEHLQKKGIQVTPEIEAMVEAAVKELDWMTQEIIGGILEDPENVGA